MLNSPAHPCRYRRFACPLTGANARLAEKRGSVTPSFRGTCTPYLLPVRLAHQTQAFVDGSASIASAGGLDVAADATNSVVTRALATPDGAPVGDMAARDLLVEIAEQTGRGAQAPDGGNIVSPAAIAFTTLASGRPPAPLPAPSLTIPIVNLTLAPIGTEAFIRSSGPVAAGTEVRVSAVSSSASATTADAAGTDSANGLGGSVAINFALVSDTAFVDGANLSAPSVRIETGTGTTARPAPNQQRAEAISGAAANVDQAGAFAFNLASSTSEALVRGATSVTGDVVVVATNASSDEATARPAPGAGGAQGVGLSVAAHADIAPALTRAEIQDGAVLTGANDVTFVADSDRSATVTAEAGAGTGGDTATTRSLAGALTQRETVAGFGAGTPLDVTGALSAQVVHRGTTTTRGRGDTAGPTALLGGAVALTIADDTARAGTARDLSAVGDVSFLVDAIMTSEAEALGSQAGAGASDPGAGSTIAEAIEFLAGLDGPAVPPIETGDDPVGATAAIAANFAVADALASVTTATTVNAGGQLTLRAAGTVNASARADAGAADGALGVAVAVAVNVPDVTTEARIDGSVNAGSIVVETTMAGVVGSLFTVEAVSGAGATAVGAAGALAINFVSETSQALLASGSSATVGGGDVTVSATSNSAAMTTATAIEAGGGVGIGGSFALTVETAQTRAEVASLAALTGAANVTIAADADHASSTAAEAGAAGGTPVAPAVALDLSTREAIAQLASGLQALVLTGAFTVRATQRGSTSTRAKADAAGAGVAGGAGIAVSAAVSTAGAAIERDITANGDVTIAAALTIGSDATATASAAGAQDGTVPIDQQIADQLANLDAGLTIPAVVTEAGQAAMQHGVDLAAIGGSAAIAVNAGLADVTAMIVDGLTVSSGGALALSSALETDAGADADAGAVDSTTAIGGAAALNFVDGDSTASIGSMANVTGVGVSLEALSGTGAAGRLEARAKAGAGAVQDGIAGSVAANLLLGTTGATIGNGATVNSGADLTVLADSDYTVVTAWGDGPADAGNRGVGVALALSVLANSTTASIGESAVTDAAQSINIRADATVDVDTTSVAGISAATASLAGSVALNGVVAATTASIGQGAQATAGQDVGVHAGDTTTVASRTGATVGTGFRGGGGGLDFGAIVKTTRAFIAGAAAARQGNVVVEAVSREDIAAAAAGAQGAFATIAGAGGVYVLTITTQAFIDAGTVVFADGSIVVAADDATEIDISAGALGNTLVIGIGASLAVPIVDKVTEAYVAGADAQRMLAAASVTANGNGPGVDVRTGNFVVTFADDATESDDREVRSLGFSVSNALEPVLSFSLIDVIAVGAPDRSFTEQRTATPETRTIQGLAVTATSRDDVETLTRGFAGALGVAVELSGAAKVIKNSTSAFIGNDAVVNTDQTGAASEQSVLIAAGTDSYVMGIAGAASASAVGAAGGAADLTFVNNQTTASIGNSAVVNALKDVEVRASGTEDVLAIAGGATSSILAISGSLPVISVNSQTHAFVGADAVVDAGGNVLIKATDDTDTDVVSGSASVGAGIGDGTSLGATLIGRHPSLDRR